MRRKIMNILILSVLLISMAGCERETDEENSGKMQGMQHLYASNAYGYYFEVYSAESEHGREGDQIEIAAPDEELYFMIENAGKNRKMAIQVFIDYVQVPIVIDGKDYLTYEKETGAGYSGATAFHFKNAVDKKTNHKLTVTMTASSDVHSDDMEDGTLQPYSLSYDYSLILNPDFEMKEASVQNYEKETVLSQDMWNGILFNFDLKKHRRSIPPATVTCKTGQNLTLQYFAGGYENCSEAVILFCIGMQQAEINHQKFIRVKTGNQNIVRGTVSLKAPEKAGEYEVTGWIIPDPYAKEQKELMPLDAVPRFTLVVK
ncbi:MAG: hypothetical protein LKF52_07545 [Butyrivibrio sp.]|nr:hypothetical protein [Butyrivibrio sp.]